MFAVEGTPKCCEEYEQPYEGITATSVLLEGHWDMDMEDATYYAKKWAKRCLDEFADAVGRGDMPIRKAIGAPFIIQKAIDEASKCPTCSQTAVRDVLIAVRRVQNKIDHTVNRVSSTSP